MNKGPFDCRDWVVYRTQQHTLVYTGIKAATREEALAAFYDGAGEVQPEREQFSEWSVDAVDVRQS